MNIDIYRIALRSDYTIGRLYINGIYLCDTLELPENNNALGKPCIPRGIYAVHLTMSPRFHRVLPLLLNVPGYEGIRIHPGNTVKDTKGCILVGWNMERGRHLLHGTFLDINQEKAENCTKNEIFLAVFVHNAYLCSS